SPPAPLCRPLINGSQEGTAEELAEKLRSLWGRSGACPDPVGSSYIKCLVIIGLGRPWASAQGAKRPLRKSFRYFPAASSAVPKSRVNSGLLTSEVRGMVPRRIGETGAGHLCLLNAFIDSVANLPPLSIASIKGCLLKYLHRPLRRGD